MSPPLPPAQRSNRWTRRLFLASLFLGTPTAVAGHAFCLEPRWLQVSHLRLTNGRPRHRMVHFTDIHHKHDAAWLRQVVKTINAQSPEFTLFTGDLVEDKDRAPEALEILAGIRAPTYGVPGNHDYWSRMPFGPVATTFAATGGAWLVDQAIATADGAFEIVGSSGNGPLPRPTHPKARSILLVHYPAFVKQLHARRFDLLLAGHSHGGQVRLPLVGALALPHRVDEYERGLYRTPWGPLYVGTGLGWYHLNVRFLCRPEITVIEF